MRENTNNTATTPACAVLGAQGGLIDNGLGIRHRRLHSCHVTHEKLPSQPTSQPTAPSTIQRSVTTPVIHRWVTVVASLASPSSPCGNGAWIGSPRRRCLLRWVTDSANAFAKKFCIPSIGYRDYAPIGAVGDGGRVCTPVPARAHILQLTSSPYELSPGRGYCTGANMPKYGTLWAVETSRQIYR
jgi:hypothetical protein